jgi:hypothetical protein
MPSSFKEFWLTPIHPLWSPSPVLQVATRLSEGDDGAVHQLLRCHELVLPVEKLVFTLAWRPCTSLSALQAKWNKW